MRVYEIIQHGGPVMWPLLVCSVAVLTVIVERTLFWISIERKRNRALMDEVLTLAETGDWEQIREKTMGSRDHISRLLVVGIVHRDYDMGRAMEAEANLMIQRMNRYMPVLDTMITVAPLLGIFGTVLGIIASFKVLGTSGIADPKLVTSGIAQALITTAAGLGISIIAVIPYNYFNTRISRAIHVMEKYATNLEVVYEKLGKKS
jgi:biopolymer transport protein ExbB